MIKERVLRVAVLLVLKRCCDAAHKVKQRSRYYSRFADLIQLRVDFCHNTGADGTTAFTNSEAQAFFHSDWVNQFNTD